MKPIDNRHLETIQKEFTHGYVSFRKENDKAPKVFLFPLSREGFQTIKNKKQLANLLKVKFREAYPDAQMQCPYDISQAKGTNPMRDTQHKLTAQCRICTNTLVYVKSMFGQNEYKLVKMVEYHVHGKDPHKVQQLLHRTQNYHRFTSRQGRPYEVKPIYIDQKIQSNIQEFIKALPVQMTNASRCKIVCQRFKITKIQYQNVIRSIRAQYEISFRQLLERFDKKMYSYRYLPQNILDINQDYIANQKKNQYLASIRPYDAEKQKNVHQIDILNPDIPNVLMVITPQMRQLFHKYGQYVGFDLTFSLIREKPQHAKEYLVGVMAGTSQSRRIMVYGLIITNNQSQYVYKHIFRQFIKIMGKCPETLVTDEQMSLHYALDSLAKQGVFTGTHLLDMFHVLKKFRKSCQSGTFQLFRKMMHARDRLQYRRALNEIMLQASNDQQLTVIKNFDYNSERYCYSQIEPSFVGIGISDSMNEKFHDLIKAQLPYETKYMKAINIILDLIQSRNELNRYGIIDKNPIQQKMTLPFMKQYRTVLSDKIFHFLLKQVCKSLPYILISEEQEFRQDLKYQEGSRPPIVLHNKDKYRVKNANNQIFIVFKVYNYSQIINEERRFPNGKWKCICQFQEKSGYLCSHIVKVLMTIGQDFYDNINSRWVIRQDQIDQGVKKFIFRERKFHHFTRVRMRRTPRMPMTEEGEQPPRRNLNHNYYNDNVSLDDDSVSEFSHPRYRNKSNESTQSLYDYERDI